MIHYCGWNIIIFISFFLCSETPIRIIKRNNLRRTIPIKKGLGKEEQILNINSLGPSSYITDNGEEKIKIITINDFVFNNDINVGLIKLDIEGFELDALKGAEKTIKKYRPVLSIAIYHNGREFFETINFIHKIYSEYTCIIRKLNPFSAFQETVLIVWIKNN